MNLTERLKYARNKLKLSGAQVKSKTGIGESTLSEFENGKREPSMNQLHKLAQLYHRSISFFLEEGALPSETVLWREKPEEGEGDIEAKFIKVCEQYRNLEIWLNETMPECLPPAQGDARTFSYKDAEALAVRVRDILKLGDRPGKNLLSVLEEVCGIKIFHFPFEPTGTAASIKSDSLGSAILLNSKNVRWRRNFDLAHELFHLLTWNLFRSNTHDVVTSEIVGEHEEKLATCFARHLLMPVEVTRIAVQQRSVDGKISYESLFDIARQFDVSIEALLWHLHFVFNRGPENKAETEEIIRYANSLCSVLDQRENEEPHKWPDRYVALAIKALRRGEISTGRFAEYLDISRHEAMKFTEQEDLKDEEIRLTPA